MSDKEETKAEAVEPEAQVEQPSSGHPENGTTGNALSHRYVCEACTGVAYYSNGAKEGHVVAVCNNCGANLGAVNPNNFIELTQDQKDALK